MRKIILLVGYDHNILRRTKIELLRRDDLKEYNLKEFPVRTTCIDDEDLIQSSKDELKRLKEENKVIDIIRYTSNVPNTNYVDINFRYTTKEDVNEEDNYVIDIGLDSYINYISAFEKDEIIPISVRLNEGDILQYLLEKERGKESPNYNEMCKLFMEQSKFYKEIIGIDQTYSDEIIAKSLIKEMN